MCVSIIAPPPDPPLSPNITAMSNTLLYITWSPPWPHPISDYTLFVRNNVTKEEFNYTTTQAYYELTKESHNFSVCQVLYISVLTNTEVGSSGKSDESSYGFIKGMKKY